MAARRDTDHDRETFGGTLVALAEAIHALTFPTFMLVPATVDQLIEALKIDYENGGCFDIGTFACGCCLANGTTYNPWSDEAVQWIVDNSYEIQLEELVGPTEDLVNLCPDSFLESAIISALILFFIIFLYLIDWLILWPFFRTSRIFSIPVRVVVQLCGQFSFDT